MEKENLNHPHQQDMGLNIELPQEIAEGTYINLAIIAHSSAEFVLDFVRILPGLNNAKVKHRVIMAPEHAKRLLFALQENIARYENSFGTININPPSSPTPPPNIKV